VCKGVGGQFLEFKIKGFPFLKEGGCWCCVLLRICNEEVIVIIVKDVDNSSGIRFVKLAGRDFA